MEQFEHFGQWWDADDPEVRWPGTLRFDPIEGAVLTVQESSPATLPEFFNRTFSTYDVILGETTDGKDVTLLRCRDQTLGGGGPGKPATREILAHAVLVGFHGDGADPSVSGADVVFRHANYWWGQSGFEVSIAGKFPNADVSYREPVSHEVFVDGDLRVSIAGTLASLPFHTSKEGAYQLREEFRVSIRSDEPRPLSEVRSVAHACQDLLSIACQRYCEVERLSVSGVDPLPIDASFHAVSVFRPRRLPSSIHPNLLFSFRDIAEAPHEIFTPWLAQAERLLSIRGLYSHALYGKGFIEARFFFLAQAVEAFHRRFRCGEYMEVAKFEKEVRAPLWDAIPAGIEEAHRNSLRTAIEHGNDYSLRTRLKDLLKEFGEPLAEVVPDADQFIHPIVIQRNSFTHVLEEVEGPPVETEDWQRYIFLLRVLLEMCFLKLVGFSDEDIKRLASSCSEYQQRADHLFGSRTP